MINVKYPRRGFVVEEIVEGCKTEGCTAEKFVVNSWEHYGEDTFNDLTDGQSTGQHSTSDYTEGSCHKCKKPVVYKDYFVITSDANTLKTPEDAYYYALNVLKAPFPEGEVMIATDAGSAACYARYILKTPWAEGEAAIAKDAKYSFGYAKDVLRGKFLQGEATIATSAEYSYNYAIYVLKAPFLLGEAAIATSNYYYKEYKKLFPEPQVVAPEPQAPDSMNIVSGFYLKEKSSMSDKRKRKDVIKSTFLTLVYTLEDIIDYDQEGGTYHFIGSLFQADNILKSIHDLMETFPNLTRDLAEETYPKVKSYMDEYSKYRKEKQEKEKPNV